ncbi:MAG: hypothetical protein ACP5OE_08425, partial [Thermodesulfobium sp.]
LFRDFHVFIVGISRAYNIPTPEAVFLAIRVMDDFYRARAKLEEIKHKIGELDTLENQKKNELEYLDRAIAERKEALKDAPAINLKM